MSAKSSICGKRNARDRGMKFEKKVSRPFYSPLFLFLLSPICFIEQSECSYVVHTHIHTHPREHTYHKFRQLPHAPTLGLQSTVRRCHFPTSIRLVDFLPAPRQHRSRYRRHFQQPRFRLLWDVRRRIETVGKHRIAVDAVKVSFRIVDGDDVVVAPAAAAAVGRR